MLTGQSIDYKYIFSTNIKLLTWKTLTSFNLVQLLCYSNITIICFAYKLITFIVLTLNKGILYYNIMIYNYYGKRKYAFYEASIFFYTQRKNKAMFIST